MANEYFDCGLVKERFALLLSKLHEEGLPSDYISKTIVESPFFDCFEKNDLALFLSTSLESISSEVFKKETVFDYSSLPGDAYYWAGLAIMKIVMNLRLPLRRVLFTMPIKEFVACFEPYHEMSDEQFLEHFSSVEKSRSLLKAIRAEKGFSLPKISFLTGIKMPTLARMDSSTESLLGTSFANLSALSSLLGIPCDAFKRTSSYVPFSPSLLRDEKMAEILGENIRLYFNVPAKKGFSIAREYLESKEIKAVLEKEKPIVDLSDPFGIIYLSGGRAKRRFLSKEEFLFLYSKSCDELKQETRALLF